MADTFIYGGLALLALSSLYGIYVGIEGLKEMKRNVPGRIFLADFMYGPKSPRMRRLTRIFYIGAIIGLVVTAIGIGIGFHS